MTLLLALTALSGTGGCTRGEPTVFSIAVHPTNPKILYVATKETVFKTRDGGQTWTPMREGLEQAQVITLAIDPVLSSTIYAGTFATAVYKSSDGGQRWRPANIGLKGHVSVVTSIVIHPRDTNIVYIGTTIGPYRSTDGGASWVEYVHGMESVYVASLAIDPQNPSILYAGTTGGIYKSTDRGERWEIINTGLIEMAKDSAMALGVNAIVIDPVETQNLFIGTTQGIFVSTDGGRQWVPRNEGLDAKFINRLLMDTRDRKVLYAGTDKGVYKSTDGANSWKPVNQGLTNRVVRSMALDPSSPNTLYVGTQGGLFKSTDGAESWSLIPLKTTN